MTKLDGIRLLEEGELAGHLTAILGRISRDESQRAMQEVLQLVVERLQTAGQADAKACIEVLEELACRGSVEAKYHLAVAKLAFGDGAKDAAVACELLEQVIASEKADGSSVLAMMALGNTGALLAMGVGCERDEAKGLARLLEASSMGCIEACLNAAVLLDPDVGSSPLIRQQPPFGRTASPNLRRSVETIPQRRSVPAAPCPSLARRSPPDPRSSKIASGTRPSLGFSRQP